MSCVVSVLSYHIFLWLLAFFVDYAEEYNLPLFRIEQIMLDSEDFELLQKIDNQIFK